MKIIKNPAALLLTLPMFCLGCANRIPPSGGEKDDTPPTLLYTYPKNESLHFDKSEIIFTFDEYIREKDIQRNILITPGIASENIKFRVLGKRLHIGWTEPLQADATYTINLDGCIADITEGNTVKDLRYVFSTGGYIDSLSIKGKVVKALTQQPAKDVSVVLAHVADTTALSSRKFPYYARSDSLGHFSFTHLKKSMYKLYAFVDKDNNKQINISSEAHGFFEGSIILTEEIPEVTVAIYEADGRKLEKVREQNYKGYYDVVYNKEVHLYSLLAPREENLFKRIIHHSTGAKIRFYNPGFSEKDIAKLSVEQFMLSVRDIIGNCREDIINIHFSKSGEKDTFTFSVKNETYHEKVQEVIFVFIFNKPVKNVAKEKLKIIKKIKEKDNKETTQEHHLKIARSTWQKARTKWEIACKIPLMSESTTATQTGKSIDHFILKIEEGTFESIEGDLSKSKKLTHIERKKEAYGSVAGKLENTQRGRRYLIRLVNTQKDIIKKARDTTFTFEKISPGDYFLQATEDKNNDKHWNPGNILKERPIERVVISEMFSVQKNWNITHLKLDFSK